MSEQPNRSNLERLIREKVEEGLAISEIGAALKVKLTTYAVRMLWFAAVDGGPEVHLCAACVGAGERGGVPCKPCDGKGIEG
jgi:hypothetical protein